MKCSFTWRSALHLTQQKALITSAAARVFPLPRESWRPGAKRAGERDLQGVWVQMQIKTSRRCACLQASYFPHRRRSSINSVLILLNYPVILSHRRSPTVSPKTYPLYLAESVSLNESISHWELI